MLYLYLRVVKKPIGRYVDLKRVRKTLFVIMGNQGDNGKIQWPWKTEKSSIYPYEWSRSRWEDPMALKEWEKLYISLWAVEKPMGRSVDPLSWVVKRTMGRSIDHKRVRKVLSILNGHQEDNRKIYQLVGLCTSLSIFHASLHAPLHDKSRDEESRDPWRGEG